MATGPPPSPTTVPRHDDDGCQIAPQPSTARGWPLVAPALLLLARRWLATRRRAASR